MNVYDANCPNCQHAFTITDEQLAIKNGFVRCSHCKTIFSATEQLQQKNLPANTPTASKTSTAINDHSDDVLFDDESGLDESGNIVIEKVEKPAHPYAIAKKTATSKKTSADDDFAIIENFDALKKPIASKSVETLVKDDTTTKEDHEHHENLWLESLLNEASEKEEIEQAQPINKAPKRYGKPAFNTDILEQIEIVPETQGPSDLTTYQQKIDQRLSKQASSQQAVNAKFSSMSLIWGLGSLLLLGGLVAQYIVFNVDTLVTQKHTATHLSKLCQNLSLPCHLPIADSQLIEVQTLKVTSAAKKAGQTDVIFTLTNPTDNNIVYPNLKVSLRDSNDIKAQTLLTPANYLEAGNSYLMPNQIKPIKLRIDYPKSKTQQVDIEPFY